MYYFEAYFYGDQRDHVSLPTGRRLFFVLTIGSKWVYIVDPCTFDRVKMRKSIWDKQRISPTSRPPKREWVKRMIAQFERRTYWRNGLDGMAERVMVNPLGAKLKTAMIEAAS